MKKSLFIIGLLAVLIPAIASAEDTKNVDVEYEIAETYTWSIPTETITIDEGEVTVEVTNSVIGYGKKLDISVTSQNSWYLVDTNHADNKLAYSITPSGLSSWANGVILSIPAGTTSGSVTGIGSITKNASDKAGTYSDTLTFSASVN